MKAINPKAVYECLVIQDKVIHEDVEYGEGEIALLPGWSLTVHRPNIDMDAVVEKKSDIPVQAYTPDSKRDEGEAV